jgi:GMP synthase (glutamine-hydrolysing)
MILIVDMNYKKESLGYEEFVSPIVSIAGRKGKVKVKHFSDLRQESLPTFEKVILSGTALKDHATLRCVGKFDLLKTFKYPVLGICAGMQTMALAFGSRLQRHVEIGMREITTVKENPLFSSKFNAYTLHNYSVKPYPDFEVLATASECNRIEAIKHKERDLYGVLFHPEVRNADIIERFLSLNEA